MTKRNFPNWLEAFYNWTAPLSQAPESYLMFSGLFALSCVLKRKVKVSREYLGNWDSHPNLFILFVAPPGVATKSTTIGMAERLLDNIPGVTRVGGTFTTPIVTKALVDSPDASCYLSADELGLLVDKSGEDIYSLLISLYDGKQKLEDRTVTRGDFIIEKPSVQFFAGTTPKWIHENMREAVLHGGFGSRVLSISEDKPRKYQLIYKKTRQQVNYEEIEQKLVDDLLHISSALNGDYHMDDETCEWLNNWYVDSMSSLNEDERQISGYVQRRPDYTMKIAMLLKAAKSDDLILTIPDLQEAVFFLKNIEPKITQTYRNVGRNKYTADIDGMFRFIQERQTVSYAYLMREFSKVAEPNKLKELINALGDMGKVVVTKSTVTGEVTLTAVNKNLQKVIASE